MDLETMKGAANKVGGRLQQGLGKMTGDRSLQAEGLAREADGTLHKAVGEAKNAAGEAMAHVEHVADDAGDRLREAGRSAEHALDEGAERVQDLAARASRTFERHPLPIVLAAAGIGFVLATVLQAQARVPLRRR